HGERRGRRAADQVHRAGQRRDVQRRRRSTALGPGGWGLGARDRPFGPRPRAPSPERRARAPSPDVSFVVPPAPPPPIGFWMAVALVMGNMIGSGIFLLPSSLARFGGLGLAGWLVSAVGAVALALVFARLARLHPAAGGPYAFTRRAFGDF